MMTQVTALWLKLPDQTKHRLQDCLCPGSTTVWVWFCSASSSMVSTVSSLPPRRNLRSLLRSGVRCPAHTEGGGMRPPSHLTRASNEPSRSLEFYYHEGGP